MTISILNLIIDAVNTQLSLDMQSLIDAHDATKVGLVRAGVLQASPTDYGISVLTHLNDLNNPEQWRHGLVSVGSGSGLGMAFEHTPYEIGGGAMWYRRFMTQMIQFWNPTADRITARNYAAVILSRAEHSIQKVPMNLGPDDFGESAIQMYVHSSVNVEGGGQGQYIWQGSIWFQVLTGKV